MIKIITYLFIIFSSFCLEFCPPDFEFDYFITKENNNFP